MRGPAAAIVLLVAMSSCSLGTANHSASPTPASVRVRWSPTPQPAGMEVGAAVWLQISGAGGIAANRQLAAIFRPSAVGPFPVIVYLHGAGGLTGKEVGWAGALAGEGFIVIAGCWLLTSAQAGFVPCPQVLAGQDDAVTALIETALGQNGARKPLGLIGISEGGFEVTRLLSKRTDIAAAVVDSGAVDVVQDDPRTSAHLLFIGGTADTTVLVTRQRGDAERLRALGDTVETQFYEGGGHVITLDARYGQAATGRVVDFLKRSLT